MPQLGRMGRARGRGRGRGFWGRSGGAFHGARALHYESRRCATSESARSVCDKPLPSYSNLPSARHVVPSETGYSSSAQHGQGGAVCAASEALPHDAAEAELIAQLSIPATQKLSVYLPFTPLFTPATATDRRLRQVDQLSSIARAELRGGANGGTVYSRWDSLPANPLCCMRQCVGPTDAASVSTLRAAATSAQQPPGRVSTVRHPLGSAELLGTCAVRGGCRDDGRAQGRTAEGGSREDTRRTRCASGEAQRTGQGVNTVSRSANGVASAAGVAAPLPFHCDACQKSFASAELLATHQATHLYCIEPGCHFTCKQDRPWKMEEHVQLLHRRPNAPDLLDTGAYLAQRRRRYPTQAQVQSKVEELYYKAARGVFLPGERRQWLRQHGVRVVKRPRDGSFYVVRKDEAQGDGGGGGTSSSSNGEARTTLQPSNAPPSPPAVAPPPYLGGAETRGTADGGHDDIAAGAERNRDEEVVVVSTAAAAPPDEEARRAPPGEVPDKETSSAAATQYAGLTAESTPFLQAALPPSCPAQEEEEREARTSTSSSRADSRGREVNVCEEESTEEEEDGDDAPPTPQGAHRTDRVTSGTADTAGAKEVTKVLAPVAAAKLARRDERRPRHADGPRRHDTSAARPSLYERLTEEDRLTERGLLLQAIHFFVAHDFLRNHA